MIFLLIQSLCTNQKLKPNAKLAQIICKCLLFKSLLFTEGTRLPLFLLFLKIKYSPNIECIIPKAKLRIPAIKKYMFIVERSLFNFNLSSLINQNRFRTKVFHYIFRQIFSKLLKLSMYSIYLLFLLLP